MRKMVEGGFEADKMTLLPTFVDVERFRTGATPPGRRTTILYLGQLRPEKGVDVLIRAWSRLRLEAERAGVRLVITGAGPAPYEAQLRELAAGNATIEFTGAMPVQAVPQLFHNARASVVPSIWYENLPNSLLESYASGTPVIASSVGSLAEVVTNGETGWTFPAGSEAGLAACLQRALDSTSGLDAMGIRARNRAMQEYNPSLHLQRLLTVFDSVDERPLGVAAVAS
jgi:glycosyltransferase involved in cell wall biosynthesis